jgi:arylformamidase
LNGFTFFLMHLRLFLLLAAILTSGTSFAQRKETFANYFRILDVPYARLPEKQKQLNMLDVYMPKKGSNSPVIIWIHDGFWTSGDKRDVDTKPDYFASNGYIFISINYRLAPAASNADQLNDVAKAIVWVYNNIIHYSGDKNSIFLMGFGSGAQLATMAIVNEKYLRNASGSVNMVKGIVSLDGIGFDIPKVMPLSGSKAREGMVTMFGNSEKLWREHSAVTYIKPGIDSPPFMIGYSGKNSAYQTDAQALAKKLADADIRSKVAAYPQKTSGAISRELGKSGDKVTEDVMRFIMECLR